MKKNVIALLLAVVLVSGNIGSVPALAAETTAEDTAAVEEENVEGAEEVSEEPENLEVDDVVEDSSEGDAAEKIEEESEQELTLEAEDGKTEMTEEIEIAENSKEAEYSEKADTSAEMPEEEEPETVIAEEMAEVEGKEAKLAEVGDAVDSGTCGENAAWTLMGTGSERTLTISGSGEMNNYSASGDNVSPWNSDNTIKRVIIESGINNIGDWAFYNISSLQEIIISDGVTTIGEGALCKCNSLHSIDLPDSIMTIGDGALEETGIEVFTVPPKVTEISDFLFYGSSIKRIDIHNGVTSIGKLAFYFSGLNSIDIPNTIASIGDSAFSWTPIESIVLPQNLERICSSMFLRCGSLKSIIIPESVKKIEDSAFYDCSSLTDISFTGSKEKWDSIEIIQNGNDVLFNRDIQYENNAATESAPIVESGTCGKNATWTLTGTGDDLTLTISGSGEISDYSWQGNPWYSKRGKIKTVIVDSGITAIGNNSFQFFYNLTSISLPEGITRIGICAFTSCNNLTGISLPESVNSIGTGAFNNCSNLRNISIPAGVTNIEDHLLAGCYSLTDITLPENMTKLGHCAFEGCRSLTEISIPEGVTTIGEFAFMDCHNLTSISLPEGLVIIGQYAFNGCIGLKSITIPYSVMTIGNEVFCNLASDYNIVVYRGSFAAEYAEANELNYTEICKTHTWNEEYTVDREATLTEEGSESIHCSLCDAVDESTVRVIPKKDHLYGDWTVTMEATCTEAGSREKVCTDCGDKVIEEIPATGHIWNNEYIVDREATCIEEGSESIHCSLCDAIDESTIRVISKKDHAYGDWTVTKEATCTEEGTESIHCSDCGTIDESTVRTIPAKGHTWNEEYTVDKEATRTEEGAESIHCSVCDISDESTVRAIPKISAYQIEYFLGGGENSSENPDLYFSGDEYTLKAPARVGYTFEGWFSDENLTDNITSITQTQVGDLVLYAKWKPNTYNVTFNGNTANSGIMSQISYTVGSTVLPANAYTKKEYIFAGWNTKADGTGTTIKNKGSLAALKLANGSKVTLYAQWKVKEYKIVYTLNGGTNNKSNPATYSYFKAVTSLANPTRKGYAFKGWFADAKYKTAFSGIEKGSTGNKTVYAKWSAVKYSIQYMLNGGKAPTGNPASYYITTATTKLKNPTRKGYTFAGWFKESTFKTKVTSITKGSAGNLKLYAKWVPTKYTITYKLNGGTNNKSNPANYTITAAKITLQKPTRKGYTFEGWFSDSGYKNKSAVINKGSTGNKTFYAKWKINKYTISYVLNGGKAPTGNPTSYYVTTATTKLKNPTRTGYTFAGWYKESTFKNKVTSILKGSAGNLKLYAKWTATKYKITYNLNGGTNNKSNPATYTIATASIKLQKPTRKGCVFEGWYSDSKFKNKVTAISKGSTGNKTLYARWKIYEYTITYVLNGGKFPIGNPASYNVDTSTIILKEATKKGYIFDGWYKESTFETKVTSIPKGTTGNLILYAKWDKEKTIQDENYEKLIKYILENGSSAGGLNRKIEYNGIKLPDGTKCDSRIIYNPVDNYIQFDAYTSASDGVFSTELEYDLESRTYSAVAVSGMIGLRVMTAEVRIEPETYKIKQGGGEIVNYSLRPEESSEVVATYLVKKTSFNHMLYSFIAWEILLKSKPKVSLCNMGFPLLLEEN